MFQKVDHELQNESCILLQKKWLKKGHNVYFFASGDSKTSANLISVTNKTTSFDLYENSPINVEVRTDYKYFLISKCYYMAKQGCFDLIHSLFDIRSAFLLN